MKENEKKKKQEEVIPAKISTGNKELDDFLSGGYEKGVITTLYGPSGSGKTTLCLITTLDMIKKGKKVIYMDTEASFSIERVSQISSEDNEGLKKIMSNILFLKPVDFGEQQKAFDKLRHIVDNSVGLIIVDTISMLYRLAMGQTKDIYEVNKKLGIQISYLTQLSRKKQIPVLIANQVYSSFDEKDKVNIVGGDILKYGSKTLLELQNNGEGNRSIIVKKSRSMPEEKRFNLKIINEGIKEVE